MEIVHVCVKIGRFSQEIVLKYQMFEWRQILFNLILEKVEQNTFYKYLVQLTCKYKYEETIAVGNVGRSLVNVSEKDLCAAIIYATHLIIAIILFYLVL